MGTAQRCRLNALNPSARIEFGDDCAMSGVTICAKDSILFGKKVMLGAGAVISDTDFHSLDPELRGRGVT